MSKYCPFKHASHNLEVHNFLKESGKYSDWQVTTAFYTSMKFFEGSLFPYQYKHPDSSKNEIVEFKTYNQYRTMFNKFVGGTPHEAMKHFVKHNTNSEIWCSYMELYDICHNSRYKNYVIKGSDLSIAIECLDDIKKYCIKNQK